MRQRTNGAPRDSSLVSTRTRLVQRAVHFCTKGWAIVDYLTKPEQGTLLTMRKPERMPLSKIRRHECV